MVHGVGKSAMFVMIALEKLNGELNNWQKERTSSKQVIHVGTFGVVVYGEKMQRTKD